MDLQVVREMKDLQHDGSGDDAPPEEIGQLAKVLILIALLGVIGAILYIAGLI